MGKTELVALLGFFSWCLVIVVWLFFVVPWVCLQFVIVVLPDHTHLLFLLSQKAWEKFCKLYFCIRIGPLFKFKCNRVEHLQIRYMGLDARKPVSGVCEQHRRRPACASAQSDQRLCYSLMKSIICKLAKGEISIF